MCILLLVDPLSFDELYVYTCNVLGHSYVDS